MLNGILNGTPFLCAATERGREEMHRALLGVAPGLEYFSVGRSICGREIIAYKVGNGRGRVAFFGAHHALESMTANVLYAFIYILHSRRQELVTGGLVLSHLLSLYTYYVVPCVNPDGIELRLCGEPASPLRERLLMMSGGDFSRWQANERGVDLNHNYDFGFAEYKRVEAERGIVAGATLYSGEYPESEPESRAVANLIRIIAPRAVVSLHTQGEEIYYSPPSALPLARRFSALTGYLPAVPTDTAAYGGLCDYTGNVLGIPSLTVEVGRGKNPLPESAVPLALSSLAPALLRLPTLL